MQLVAYGAQDIYLTGNPQITFFKVVYRRHTNFSMESIKQSFLGKADFGGMVEATISRNGDLVGRMYLEHNATFTADVPGFAKQIGLVERYGDSLIEECEIEIGGQRIDKHTSMWNRVYSDLTEFNPSGYFYGAGNLVPDTTTVLAGDGTLYQKMSGNGLGLNTGPRDTEHENEDEFAGWNEFGAGNASGLDPLPPVNGFTYTRGDDTTTPHATASIKVNKIFLPLNFWFCRNPGLSLPLIALQYHEVKVKISFEEIKNLTRCYLYDGDEVFRTPVAGTLATTRPSGQKFNLWCDYIYLDTDERRRFAQVSHEYLIEQIQYSETTVSSRTPSIDLNFNHPVKELIWTMRNETDHEDSGRHGPFDGWQGDASSGPVSLDEMGGTWQLKLNGHDRFKRRDTKYFTRTQVWQHHTGYGGIPTFGLYDESYDDLGTVTGVMRVGGDSIAVYSFALKPEEHQPSGTCNFSRIDNAQLVGNGIQTPVSIGEVKIPSSVDSWWGFMPMVTVSGTTTTANVKLTIFAVNYNVLRIMSGMGGLAYSN